MPTNHEAVAAWPVGANADKEAIRAMETRRFAYCLGDDENAGDLKVIDPATGVKPLYLVQNSTLYQLDDDDATTDAGATCLVSNDGKRYKSDAVGIPFSVLDKDTSAQPASPSVGDRYIIPTGATGTDWSGKDGKVGEYTERGWIFSTIPIGRSVYVRDEDARYYRNDSGVWTVGGGSVPHASGSIPITAIIGAKASFDIKVENQITNTPPPSPVAPVAYIIGPTPTDSWSGHPGDLAICLVDGSFTIISPDAGDRVYDKALGYNVRWNGTAWVSASGRFLTSDKFYTSSSTWSKPDRLVFLDVVVIGGGGGSYGAGGNGGSGGTSQFGVPPHISASGGAGGTSSAGGASGTGNGGSGSFNLPAMAGGFIPANVADGLILPSLPGPFGLTYGSGAGPTGITGQGSGGGGRGGGSRKTILASIVGSNETVTVGAAGSGGSGGFGAAGSAGLVWVREYLEN